MSEGATGGGLVELRVRYAETDQMARAHHMHYVAWFELGRTALMRENGVSYAELERQGVLLPVDDLRVTYRRGATYDDRIAVRTRVAEVRSRSVAFAYEVRSRPDDELLATGETWLVCTGRDMRPRRLPESVRAVLTSLRTGVAS
ncbi:MAG: thioesterase family protein [Gemmatimonadota bacterium]|nr:thioesterase family protein [Gemmatimonadota bacterium]